MSNKSGLNITKNGFWWIPLTADSSLLEYSPGAKLYPEVFLSSTSVRHLVEPCGSTLAQYHPRSDRAEPHWSPHPGAPTSFPSFLCLWTPIHSSAPTFVSILIGPQKKIQCAQEWCPLRKLQVSNHPLTVWNRFCSQTHMRCVFGVCLRAHLRGLSMSAPSCTQKWSWTKKWICTSPNTRRSWFPHKKSYFRKSGCSGFHQQGKSKCIPYDYPS